MKFWRREYTKFATENFFLRRKLLLLLWNTTYSKTRRVFNVETCIRGISHEVVKIRSEVGLPVF